MRFKEWLKIVEGEYGMGPSGEVGGFKAIGPSIEDNGAYRKKGIRDKYVADAKMKKLTK